MQKNIGQSPLAVLKTFISLVLGRSHSSQSRLQTRTAEQMNRNQINTKPTEPDIINDETINLSASDALSKLSEMLASVESKDGSSFKAVMTRTSTKGSSEPTHTKVVITNNHDIQLTSTGNTKQNFPSGQKLKRLVIIRQLALFLRVVGLIGMFYFGKELYQNYQDKITTSNFTWALFLVSLLLFVDSFILNYIVRHVVNKYKRTTQTQQTN